MTGWQPEDEAGTMPWLAFHRDGTTDDLLLSCNDSDFSKRFLLWPILNMRQPKPGLAHQLGNLPTCIDTRNGSSRLTLRPAIPCKKGQDEAAFTGSVQKYKVWILSALSKEASAKGRAVTSP